MRPVPSTLEQWKCDERRGELYREAGREEMPSFLPFNGWKSLKFLTSHESQRVREDMKVQFPTRRIFVANVRWTFLFIFLFLLHFSFSFRDSRATWLSHKFAPARICFISSRAERRSLFKAWPVRACFRSKNSNSFLLPLHKFEKRIFLAKIQSTVKKSTFSRRKNFCSSKNLISTGIDYYEIYRSSALFRPWIRYPDCAREIERNFELFSHLCVTIHFIVVHRNNTILLMKIIGEVSKCWWYCKKGRLSEENRKERKRRKKKKRKGTISTRFKRLLRLAFILEYETASRSYVE